jgi:RNA polymerase sigma-54 factor
MEIKQHLKLQQQLVMTPQLQQAIKLLQLSRTELVDVVREELLENPVLEDSIEVAAEQQKASTAAAETPLVASSPEVEVERIGVTEAPVAQIPEDKLDTTAEVKADSRSGEAVADFDWDTYLETQSNAPPMLRP